MVEPRDCEHGHQARKCLTCELEAENAELRAEVERLKSANEHWHVRVRNLKDDVERLRLIETAAIVLIQNAGDYSDSAPDDDAVVVAGDYQSLCRAVQPDCEGASAPLPLEEA